jgi:hypothetical protein
MSEYTGIFKARYQTKGRVDWVKLLTEEDKAVFIRMGLGGIARARTAKRDARGRFTNGTLRS